MITPRLECILKHIKEENVADIGTDHAYIPIRLIQDGLCTKVIATDIKPGPCDAARRHILKYGLSDKIEVRMGAGLSPIEKGEVSEIIIAGMGGEMICKILSENPDKAKSARLILQPMNAQYDLRKFLLSSGYSIINEDLAVEGTKIYNIIIAEAGSQEPFEADFDYHIPPYLLKHPLKRLLLEKKIREFKKIIAGNEKAVQKDEELLRYFREKLEIAQKLI